MFDITISSGIIKLHNTRYSLFRRKLQYTFKRRILKILSEF